MRTLMQSLAVSRASVLALVLMFSAPTPSRAQAAKGDRPSDRRIHAFRCHCGLDPQSMQAGNLAMQHGRGTAEHDPGTAPRCDVSVGCSSVPDLGSCGYQAQQPSSGEDG